MRRTRTELLVALALSATLAESTTALAQDDAARAEARTRFDRGVALTKAHDYEAALREFELAYAAVPHYGVLYNIGQAQLALGRSAEAAASLQRYLDEGGPGIEAARRAEVEETLSRLRPPPPPPAPGPTPTEPAPKPAEPAPAPAAPVVATSAVNTDRYVSGRKPPEPARPAPREAASGSARTFAYVLGGASLALGGASLGHYFWNRGRYHDWQADYRDYQRAPGERERRELNELSESIAGASVVTVALAVGAAAALGTSAVLFVSSSPTDSVSGRAGETTLGVRGSF